MQINLKTTLRAYPKVSPSILSNYVTKEDLESRHYIDPDMLNSVLQDFVKDVDINGDNIVFGRIRGQWVPVVDIPQQASGIMCWGMLSTPSLSADQMMKCLSRQNFLVGVNEYSVEHTPTENGYFWFTSTTPIKQVIADSGLSYKQDVVETNPVSIEYKGQPLTFYCYRTQKLVALPNTAYKFRIVV